MPCISRDCGNVGHDLRNVSGDRDTPRALTDRSFDDFIA